MTDTNNHIQLEPQFDSTSFSSQQQQQPEEDLNLESEAWDTSIQENELRRASHQSLLDDGDEDDIENLEESYSISSGNDEDEVASHDGVEGEEKDGHNDEVVVNTAENVWETAEPNEIETSDVRAYVEEDELNENTTKDDEIELLDVSEADVSPTTNKQVVEIDDPSDSEDELKLLDVVGFDTDGFSQRAVVETSEIDQQVNQTEAEEKTQQPTVENNVIEIQSESETEDISPIESNHILLENNNEDNPRFIENIPVVLNLLDTEFLLFPINQETCSTDCSHLISLFDDYSNQSMSIKDLFDFLRFNEDLNEIRQFQAEEEMVLDIPNLGGLHITEDNVCCKNVSIISFIELFAKLVDSSDDKLDIPQFLNLNITTQPRFITKFNELINSVELGNIGFHSMHQKRVSEENEDEDEDDGDISKKRRRIEA
ncbi:uncharacterized protein J8A68_004616 [[Candida] subhashii]|uniref:Reduced meiotic recombination protein 1 n=1 Tax=[Candida] subhashii TaxID=561895 RepID=A0A8J5QGU1_9ASCO|nr:uncharacterized protein J8A68_004616 [[Candida] subhashii]KAG7661869.1 hypothetical protein J8A68_004616 [[Candida] subhashii]